MAWFVITAHAGDCDVFEVTTKTAESKNIFQCSSLPAPQVDLASLLGGYKYQIRILNYISRYIV